MPHARQHAFTLVELAIVLVIIGLLVGGVLVGQDLIKQAEIKATARQVEQFDTGGAAFRTKYYSIAGDISSNRAAQYGLVPRAGARGQGDGNGTIENAHSAALTGLGGETSLYWRDLWDGHMIGLEYNLATDAVVDSSGFTAPAAEQLKLYMPEIKIRPSGFFHIYGANGFNYYHMGTFSTGNANGTITWTSALTPYEAMGIDTKIDDGLPRSGLVQAMTGQDVPDAGSAAAAGVCVDSGTNPARYNNLTENFRGIVACQLRLRGQF